MENQRSVAEVATGFKLDQELYCRIYPEIAFSSRSEKLAELRTVKLPFQLLLSSTIRSSLISFTFRTDFDFTSTFSSFFFLRILKFKTESSKPERKRALISGTLRHCFAGTARCLSSLSGFLAERERIQIRIAFSLFNGSQCFGFGLSVSAKWRIGRAHV